MSKAKKIIVNGCAGRMGQALTRLVLDDPRLELAGGLEAPNSAALGADLARWRGTHLRYMRYG